MDSEEYLLYEKSEVSNEFFQGQCGSNRNHYKEFALAFINDIISKEKATLHFLMFCVQTFKKHKESSVEREIEQAAASLFILALMENTMLED